jgi:hypothetical protein
MWLLYGWTLSEASVSWPTKANEDFGFVTEATYSAPQSLDDISKIRQDIIVHSILVVMGISYTSL